MASVLTLARTLSLGRRTTSPLQIPAAARGQYLQVTADVDAALFLDPTTQFHLGVYDARTDRELVGVGFTGHVSNVGLPAVYIHTVIDDTLAGQTVYGALTVPGGGVLAVGLSVDISPVPLAASAVEAVIR